VILGESKGPASVGGNARVTLDELFRRAVRRRPDAVALRDPPNRPAFTDGLPRRLTYAHADRIVSGIAEQLRQMGLQTDTVVAVQLPNVMESVLVLLGVLRAGMIAAPMPLLWRRAEAVTALARVGAKVLITCRRVGSFDHCELAMTVASDLFPIRYVCAFGSAVPDGVVPFDLDTIAAPEPPVIERLGNPAAHAAIITWDVTADGAVPVVRNHTQLIFGALPVLLEGRLPQDTAILSTALCNSFAGLSAALVPWLLIGGTLALHHPFDAGVLARQCGAETYGALVLPGPLAVRLAEAGMPAGGTTPRSVIALWRSPDRLAGSASYGGTACTLTDVQVFGEIGLVAARRGIDGRPASVGFGPLSAPRGATGAPLVGEIAALSAGTLAFGGTMVAAEPFPPGADRGGQPHYNVLPDGSIDTGYPCRLDRETAAMIVTGPPLGVVTVGSHRFAWNELKESVATADDSISLAAVPDPVRGHRLVGSAADVERARQALSEVGLNPLVVGAVRADTGDQAASAA
jgi:hypothetical protein